MRFEWDPAKERSNRDKHGVGVDDACPLLESSVECLELFGVANSAFEDRFITLGPVADRLLLVVWTKRAEDVIRIISARCRPPAERTRYLHFLEGK